MHPNPAEIIFFGTPEFAARILCGLRDDRRFRVAVVVTQEDKPAGRGNRMTPPPVKLTALEMEVPVVQPRRIRKDPLSFLDNISRFGPFDLGVVAAFGQILPSEVLEFPALGCVNVHGSLLPRWRGAAPIQRALMEGDTETGISIMHMTEGLDCGPVYAKASVQIEKEDTFGTLHDRLAALGTRLLLDTLPGILDSSLVAEQQPEVGMTYASMIRKEDERIDWNHPADVVWNHIRALSPAPAAYSVLEGRRIKISGAEPVMESAVCGRPGDVVYVDRSRLEIACAPGRVSVTELQPEGRRRMQVRGFLAGAPVRTGQRME